MTKDVELVIRAKDAATKAIVSIKDALKDLTGIQEDVGASAAKTDTLLGELGRQLNTLNSEAKGLSALGKVAGEIDKAGKAVSNLESDVRKSAQEFAKLARESAAAQQNANKFRGQLEAERNALKANTDERKRAADQLRAVNKEVSQAERAQEALNRAIEKAPTPKTTRGVGKEAGAPQTSAVASAGVFTQAALTAARNEQAQLKSAVAEFDAEIAKSKQAIGVFEKQISAATDQERKLSRETEKTSLSLAKGREELAKSRTILTEITSSAGTASASFGTLALNQDKIAQASTRMAAEIARAKAQIDAINSSKPATAATGDRRATLEARRDFLAAQGEVKRLAEEMRSAQAPTVEMGAALGRAQAAARVAGEAYEANRVAAARLKNEQGSLTSFLQRTSTEQQKAANSFVQSQAALARGNTQIASTATQAASALPPIAAAARDVNVGFGSAAAGGTSFRAALTSIYGEGRQSLSLLQRIRGELLALAASYVGLYGAAQQLGGILAAYQKLEAAQSRLNAAFNGQSAVVGRELQFTTAQAQRLGIEFGQLSDQYSKFAIAAQTANFTQEATRRIFLSVAEAGRVNKLSADQMSGAFLAITQMISKGKVSAEELRGQLGERLPGAFSLFAEAIGVSTAELDKMLQAGDVAANQGTLLKFADTLDRKFGTELQNALKGTTAEIGRFWDNIFQGQVRIAQGGFIDAFTSALRDLNAYFQSREGRDFFLAIGAALGRVTNAIAAVVPYFGYIAQAIGVIIGLKLASYFTGVVAALAGASGAFGAITASTFTLSANVDILRAKFAGLAGTLAAGRASFATLTASAYGAAAALTANGAAVTALRLSLTALGTVAGVVAGAFRVLWTAVGGLPGVIITGLTFALGSWLTRVTEANTAIDEHKRIMDEVNSAYEKVRDTTRTWGQEVKNVSLDQANANVRRMREEFEKSRQAAKDFTSYDFRLYIGSARQAASSINDLRTAFVQGRISASTFRGEVEKIYAATNDDNVRRYGEGMLVVARAAEEAEKRLGAASIVAKDLGSNLDGVDKDAKAAGGSIEKLNKGSADAAETMKRQLVAESKAFNEILKEINKSIPSISEEMKRLEEIEALDKQYKAAVNLARTMGQVNELTASYNKSLEGINEKYTSRTIVGGDGGSLVDRIVGAETGGTVNPATAKNPNSSATGLGQFIESTWINLFKKYFPDRAESMSREAILELRKSEKISRDMIALYAKENADILQKAGVSVDQAALYLAHFLGPQGAVKVLQAPKGTPVADVVDQSAINANKSVLQGKTTDEVIAWAQRKIGLSKEEVALQRSVAEHESKRVEKSKEYNDDLTTRLKLKADENANEGRLSKEAFVQKALADEQKRARAAEVTLTDEQIAKIKELAAGEWEVTNAKREGKTATAEANIALQQAVVLATQRKELERQFAEAQKTGDAAKTTSLSTQLADVNLKLQEAIEKARTMWLAIGGPQADVAITKLDTLKLKADTATGSLNIFGLTSKQVQSLANSFADGLVGAFDEFARAVANGENAVKALGKAFLKFAAEFLLEIAKMILKQQILNAISAFGKAFGMPNLIPTAHTGGVIGSVGAGMGNMRRAVAPALFAGAMVYHTGGIAGLKPDEVPTILRQGEEVLTENDPRHRNNRGGEQAGTGGQRPIRQVLVLDEESVRQHLNSPAGEEVVVTHIKNNAPTIKQILG